MKTDVIIIGGGASGLVAAITAARNHASVLVLEQKDKIGKKILATGNGRCNLTNEKMEASYFRGDDCSIVPSVLSEFGYENACQFFHELGLLVKSREGYIYPFSDQASAVLDVLKMELERLHVTVMTDTKVTDIKKTTFFEVKTSKGTFCSDKVILATGGKASSVLGSDGSGYKLAGNLGHHISKVVPALVALQSDNTVFRQLAGIRTQAKVSLYIDEKFVAEDTGELQLTNYGVSGIPVFQISRFAAKGLAEKKEIRVMLDFFPTMEEKEFYAFVQDRKKAHAHKTVEEFIIGMMNHKLGIALLKQAGIPKDILISEVWDEKFANFLTSCKQFCVFISATNTFEQAQVCAGGVKTTEIDVCTMESNIVPSLYVAGELQDIDGICGGYNLHWAWATGYLAGKHASKGTALCYELHN